MPASIELANTFKDDLAIIFIESQGLAQDKAEAFAYGRAWMGTSAMWTTERPCSSGSRTLPSFVLLSNEGKVLIKGNPVQYTSAIEGLIKKEISRSKKGPDGVPKAVKKMWADFGKGKYAAACSAASKLAQSDKEDAGAAKAALDAFHSRIDSKIRRAAWMVNHGYLLEGEELLESLAKSLKGIEEHESKVAEHIDRLASEDNKSEMAAAKAFAKIEKAIKKNGLDHKSVKQLEKFIKKQEGTKAAKRAEHLAALAANID